MIFFKGLKALKVLNDLRLLPFYNHSHKNVLNSPTDRQ